MDEITGVVKKYNKSEGKSAGIQLDNSVWYNATEATEKYVVLYKDKLGTKVHLKHTGGKIAFIEAVKNDAGQPEPEHKEEPIGEVPRKVEGVTRGMCVNNAAYHVTKTMGDKALSPRQWAQKVCEHADALLEEMNEKGLL